MRRFISLFSCFVFLSVLFSGASAQSGDDKRTTPQSRKTVYDFDEADILGKLKRPEGQSIVEPPEFRFRRLLDLDESFLPNIIRSVDEY